MRRDGYALDDRENESDGRCVAVALPLTGVHAAVSVSAPVSRLPLTVVDEIAVAIAHAVHGLAADLDAAGSDLRRHGLEAVPRPAPADPAPPAP